MRRIREEEETLKKLLPDVQDRKKQQEDEMWKVFDEFIASWDREETDVLLEHQEMATGTEQRDKGGEFGKRFH